MSDDTLSLDKDWLRRVQEETCGFLRRLRDPAQAGRYLPCEHGVTEIGRAMSLGFSCFALRTLRMFGEWDELHGEERQAWAEYLRGFQEPAGEGAFRDEAEISYISRERTFFERAWHRLRRRPALPSPGTLILAETKQALATLDEISSEAARSFTGFPTTAADLRAWLERLDWSRPWGAGGQSATIVVFLRTQAPRFLPKETVEELLEICRKFFAGLADPATGAYFRGPRPEQGEMINGAMKVLMSLDWLEVRPHYADRLIATCLERLPSSRGCHLVDAIYVLHQCLSGEASSPQKQYCLKVLEQVRAHYHPCGGFSFFVRRAQDSYYGIPISNGGNEPDVHGTCLLVWAIAMIWRIVEPRHARWGVLRP